jgi:RNA ligase (TIGR02306 family)
MATFEVKVVEVEGIEPIEGADRIELAVIGGYRSVVKRGEFKPGDLAVYIPEQALLPQWLLEHLGLVNDRGEGKLAGKDGNRVKAVKLRGTLSQGITMPLQYLGENDLAPGWHMFVVPQEHQGQAVAEGETYDEARAIALGTDVAGYMGITKWEPEIPAQMAGEVANLSGHTVKYDIENLKKYPNVLTEGEKVVITEKLHGTFTCIACWPNLDHPELLDGDLFAYSKGLGEKGLVFKNVTNNAGNLYMRALKENADKLASITDPNTPLFIMGETFGDGVQDLTYGARKNERMFRVFDIFEGHPRTGRFLGWDEMRDLATAGGFDTVPVLYKGPYSKAKADELAGGETLFGGHVREGVVIKPVEERQDNELGRVIVKHINDAYLTRKGGTEFN